MENQKSLFRKFQEILQNHLIVNEMHITLVRSQTRSLYISMKIVTFHCEYIDYKWFDILLWDLKFLYNHDKMSLISNWVVEVFVVNIYFNWHIDIKHCFELENELNLYNNNENRLKGYNSQDSWTRHLLNRFTQTTRHTEKHLRKSY